MTYHMLSEDLIEEALRCNCDVDEPFEPLCVRCECLFRLIEAIENWAFEDLFRRRGQVPPRTWRPGDAP